MKVLYIGHYREGTGWSQAAIDYILALDSAGVDVVCRPVKLNANNPDLPERILQLEAKSSSGSTHCIQHVLPHLMDYSGKFKKNIGLFVTETTNITYTDWQEHLKLMDELWVPNTEMASQFVLLKDVCIVPHAYDNTRYDQYDNFSIPKMKDSYVFYFIGEFNRRKRISALLQAYYTAFDRNDNVGLVIKANKPNVSSEQLMQELTDTDRSIRENLKMFADDRYYPQVAFIPERLTDRQILGLHRSCDCFVTATFGDAWCIPAFDALAHNNHVISSDVGGMADYLDGRGDLVSGQWTPVLGADVPVRNMGTGRELWFDVNIAEFSQCMKNAYTYNVHGNSPDLSRYNYENVGKKMKDLLDA